MLTDRALFAIAVLCYGVSFLYSVFLLRQGFRQDNRLNYFVILAGFAFHTAAMIKRGFSLDRCPIHNLYEATIFVIWTIAAVYLVSGVWHRVRFLGAFASPVLFGLGVFALMPSLDKGPTYTGGLVSAHAALIALAYGAFGLGSVAAAMYLVADHNLKLHKLRAVLSLLPPIQRLESLMSALLVAGLVLLTAGLALAPLLVKQQDVVASLRGDPKIVWSAFVWLIYVGIVTLRWGFGQHGKRVAWAAVASFAFVMLTFWGFNLLSPIHNP
ncbi:MAG: cytochrome c biogenesis protein CcsA [Verrucomicrobia bacterium]|nr:cytochrome c biogenesis protein CcsA [Verrucomicrobiota bacterium]